MSTVRSLHAEDVLPGHPDRLCDAVAETIVTGAHAADPEALVGVEAALHRHRMLITGRIAAGDGNLPHADPAHLAGLAAGQLEQAGYTGRWAHPLQVDTDLDVGPLEDDERDIRRYSDDQGVTVGHADPTTPDLLPVEVHVVRRIKDAAAACRAEHPHLLGPDGKVLVRLETDGRTTRIVAVNVSLQHAPGVQLGDLHLMLLPHLQRAFEQVAPVAEAPERLDGDSLRLNGIGDFTCGGPMGDNGLSGKKLVVDHYGPHVPIGGGAICGKDAHKPDRAGALRARQVAVRLAAELGEPATVQTGFLPGLEAPDRLTANTASGRHLDAEQIGRLIRLPDLSLKGTAVDLELAAVDWVGRMRRGYFGTNGAWER